MKEIAETIRAVDLADIDEQRQTAPEYAQLAYENMRVEEIAFGNFCKYKCLNVRGSQRKAQVILIEQLNAFRKGKLSTLYSAVSISDRYLKKLSDQNLAAPDLNLLAVTCLFIAGKLEEHVVPNGV